MRALALFATIVLAFSAPLCTQALAPTPKTPGIHSETLATLDDYFAAVNARDPQKFLTFFVADEGLTVIEDKDLRLSRKAFVEFVDGFFREVSEIQAIWESRTVHPLAPGSAVVMGIFKVTGKDAKGAPMAFRSAFTFVLVKQGPRWRVKHVHESSLDL
jgi:uncharacterized protein (TIGR02246 family)